MKRQPKWTLDIDTLKNGHIYLVHIQWFSRKSGTEQNRFLICTYVEDDTYCFRDIEGYYKYTFEGAVGWVEIESEPV